jgi:hypothetical protein
LKRRLWQAESTFIPQMSDIYEEFLHATSEIFRENAIKNPILEVISRGDVHSIVTLGADYATEEMEEGRMKKTGNNASFESIQLS